MTPVLLFNCKASVYETPDGGYHISYVREDSEETKHVEIPGTLVRMAKMAKNGGNPLKMMSAMMSGTNAVE